MPIIEMGEIRLRPLEAEDAEKLYQWKNDWRTVHLLGGISNGLSKADISNWIVRHASNQDEVFWAIAETQHDSCIGHVALYRLDRRTRKAEFGILIGDGKFRGIGLGKQITKAVLSWAFGQMNLHKVSLTALATNTNAIKMYEKLGFRHEGTLRDEEFRDGKLVDVVMMSMLHDEWNAIHAF